MNLEKEINSVVEQKLNDGTLEKIVGEEFERCIKNTADRLFTSYGDIGKAIEEKIKQSMMPAIERTDFTNYLTKLDVVLTEIVNQTSLQDNKKILENFKELMIEEESKTVKFSELFEKYCEYVAKYVDTSEIKVEIVYLIEGNADKLSDKLINKLLKCGNTLEFLYDTYMEDDSANVINELATVIENLEFKIKSL